MLRTVVGHGELLAFHAGLVGEADFAGGVHGRLGGAVGGRAGAERTVVHHDDGVIRGLPGEIGSRNHELKARFAVAEVVGGRRDGVERNDCGSIRNNAQLAGNGNFLGIDPEHDQEIAGRRVIGDFKGDVLAVRAGQAGYRRARIVFRFAAGTQVDLDGCVGEPIAEDGHRLPMRGDGERGNGRDGGCGRDRRAPAGEDGQGKREAKLHRRLQLWEGTGDVQP